ncbi:MAG: hypothetical protein IPJ04_06275 [Candidatus Eisenbacteria bacterium]|nr:hypothetical protein [Candidatus Eisenbacteria bacterium]
MATRGTDVAMAALGAAGPSATAVRSLAATHHDGQTFLTWTCPPGTNWKYRVYRSASPIATNADLAMATLVGSVGDSSAYDRHLSQGLSVAYGYKIDSLATALDPARGLFVHTASASGAAWYAVTAQNSVFGENTTVSPGSNALGASVSEMLQLPRPVYQHPIDHYGNHAEVWTLFVPDHDTPLMPAMGNRPGLAYDCAVVSPPAIPFSQTTLLVPLHYRGGSLLDGIYGTGYPGEWVLGLDDWLPNGQNTFWYGYADTYDITSTATPALTSGTVMDYTLRRVNFTLDWALRTFPIDSTRVYAFGYSMGGAGSVLMGTHLGDRFAATMSVVGKSDYSFDTDPDTTCWFNPERQPAQARERDVGHARVEPARERGRAHLRAARRGLARRTRSRATVRTDVPLFGQARHHDGLGGEPAVLGSHAGERAGGARSTGRCATTTRTIRRSGRRRRTHGACIATSSTRAIRHPHAAASTATRATAPQRTVIRRERSTATSSGTRKAWT